ncbi:Murein-DD-endopeptidase [Thioalkalivibrio nitratireducens DSM 14787]|uniref:Murein-DD-endopeptidase n=1 Tax=Thioalkalivibrio nitratireducens (strain DSM 14787 / UNIQEM 213 / ALEN2) TaxID=1255043 RepID=L0DZY6_THIND|nr:D-alanyl-D-alanine endopeptidase [Thioalkalivibrio nitratireducens]AGA34562.1 Murein-DD-endopeptidase [Thioalkalivibrio nitratireducens DSM 14787]
MKNTLWTTLLVVNLMLTLLPVTAWSAGNAAGLSATQLQLASVHAAVVDLKSGDPLYAKFADRPVPIASITKLMTAMVVLDSGQPLDEWLEITQRSDDPPKNTYSRIRIGSQATREDLLRITLMSSENLAAYLLGRNHPGGMEAFIADMNAKARALGMEQTRFVDPSGLWPDNHASASDLVKMVQAAYRYPTIREMSTTSRHRVHFRNPRYSLDYGNTNSLVSSARWNVGLSKTGYLTEAGRCLVMVAEVSDQPLVMVLLDSLGTRTPLGDAGRIRRWIETGTGGAVASAAQDYERQRASALAASGATSPR